MMPHAEAFQKAKVALSRLGRIRKADPDPGGGFIELAASYGLASYPVQVSVVQESETQTRAMVNVKFRYHGVLGIGAKDNIMGRVVDALANAENPRFSADKKGMGTGTIVLLILLVIFLILIFMGVIPIFVIEPR